MKCQVLFSLKFKKQNLTMSSAANLIGPLRVKTGLTVFEILQNVMAHNRLPKCAAQSRIPLLAYGLRTLLIQICLCRYSVE